MLVDSNGKKSAYDALVPAGFSPRSAIVKLCSSSDEGQPTIAKDITSIASRNRVPSMSAPMQRPSGTTVDHETFEKENVESSSLHELETFVSEFEARMSKLEKVVAYLKAAKLAHRLA